MKCKHSQEIIERLKQINKLMDLRINQLKQLSPNYWWEESLKDDYYTFLCRKYAEIKCLEINPRMEITEGDLHYLLDKYKLGGEQEMLGFLGLEVIGNIYEHPHLLEGKEGV